MAFGESDGAPIADAFRKRSETKDATVKAVAGAVYTLTDCATGGDFAADNAVVGVTHPVGKRVIVRHDASGRAMARRPQIIGVAQNANNGAAVGALTYTVPRTAATITRLPALPVLLVKGGRTEVVTIYGVRLSGAATYGTANITDSVAQSLNDTALILRPQALIGCAPGRYSLTFAGQTIPNFFEVTA